MKIAMLSKSDRNGGGASRCAEDLTHGMRSMGHHVDHFGRSGNNSMIPLYTNFEKKIYHRLRKVGIQEIIPFEKKVIKHYDALHQYDIFHFHDISSAISPLTLKWLSDINRNVVWTIHDCSPVTGGCINPLDCNKFKSTCNHCPQLGQFPLASNFDFTKFFHMIKKYTLKKSKIHFIAPSKWMADFAYDTGHLSTYPTIISNGIDTNIFKCLNKNETRLLLDLPQNRFIILISSATLDNPFKGIKYAIETIYLLKNINPFILVVGSYNELIPQMLKGFDFHFTGYIDNKSTLNQYYSAADIFLNTTIADSQSITVLEAMASGTPNIGFGTGGIPETITHDVDGFLVQDFDLQSLSQQIQYTYNNPEYLNKMRIQARSKIVKNHSSSILLEKHSILYKSILDQD